MAISECPLEVISVVWELPALVSLKLKSLSFEIDHWPTLAQEKNGPFKHLQCLRIVEANEAHWDGLLACLPMFSEMRDLRLQFGFKVLKQDDLKALKAALDHMSKLEALELPNLDKSALASLASHLPRELRALALGDQLVDDRIR